MSREHLLLQLFDYTWYLSTYFYYLLSINLYFFLLVHCNFIEVHLHKYYKLITTFKTPIITS